MLGIQQELDKYKKARAVSVGRKQHESLKGKILFILLDADKELTVDEIRNRYLKLYKKIYPRHNYF